MRRMRRKRHLFLGLFCKDTTPGGAASALLKEDSGGILQENGSYILMEQQ